MKFLHTYGDSHAAHYGGWKNIKINDLVININHLGGKLMYSFGRDNLIVVNDVNVNNYVCFCFGEIDCRCHVNKFEPNWKETINNLVEKYFITIKNNVIKLKPENVLIYNVVPPLQRELSENLHIEKGNLLPSLGSDLQRQQYTLYMNLKLGEYCKKYGYCFLNVYNKYVNELGFLNPNYSDGNCHIKNPIFIEEFLIAYLNK